MEHQKCPDRDAKKKPKTDMRIAMVITAPNVILAVIEIVEFLMR